CGTPFATAPTGWTPSTSFFSPERASIPCCPASKPVSCGTLGSAWRARWTRHETDTESRDPRLPGRLEPAAWAELPFLPFLLGLCLRGHRCPRDPARVLADGQAVVPLPPFPSRWG